MSQLQYWVWLSMRFGVRPKMKLALVEHFGTPRDVYFATEADYRVRVPLRPEECTYYRGFGLTYEGKQ